MGIKYCEAEDIREKARKIIDIFGWNHIDLEHVGFLRSVGSSSRGTIARCHALSKPMQLGLGRTKGYYLIEVISERFDRMPEEEQIKTVIHELMHIPKAFGGGFIHHNMVNERTVRRVFEEYKKRTGEFEEKKGWFG